MLRIEGIKIYEDTEEVDVVSKAIRKNNIDIRDVEDYEIVKKSIDARDKSNVHYVYAINLKVKDDKKYSNLKIVNEEEIPPIKRKRKSKYRPIIVGAGPAGLFAALTFIDNGYKPIILEQGSKVEERVLQIEEFKTNRYFNRCSNIQFGEGGAGTFSDGKLTTGISSPLIREVLNYFYEFGAPREILYESHPHVGTDNLITVIRNMREFIEANGGEYHFNTKLTDIIEEDDHLKIITNQEIELTTDALILAIGHSARSTFKMLLDHDVKMIRKNFSVGLRIEHKQSMINESQYGTETSLKLTPAEYKLAYHNEETGRDCYTFCMCPGGEVIASSSCEESICTNGMSLFNRNKENANSALLVNITKDDFDGDNPLEGMYFQERLEKDAFVLGGSNYNAPVQRVGDFLKNIPSTKIGSIKPSYLPGYTLADLNQILPDFVSDTIKEGILYFDKKIKGFANKDAILTGVETRSSSPVTILRDDNLQCNIKGVYPCGEGPGYAGGITSAAVDGIRVATQIIETE